MEINLVMDSKVDGLEGAASVICPLFVDLCLGSSLDSKLVLVVIV